MSFTQRHTHIAKGAAILLLLYYHIFAAYNDLHFNLAQIAHCCVWIFVFLSGYGLTVSYGKSRQKSTSPLSWILKHIWSLEAFFWPHFLIGVALLYLWVGRGLMSQYGKVWRIILDFFCLSDIFGQTHILSVWWYMGLAILIVLAVPLLVKVTDKIGYFIIPAVYALILLVPDLIVKDELTGPYQGYYLAAVLGVVAARKGLLNKYVTYIEKASSSRTIVLGLLYIFGIISLGMMIVPAEALARFYLPQLIMTVNTVLVILLSVNIARAADVSKAFEFMGKLSDDMFIMHIVVRTVLWDLIYIVDIPVVIYLLLLISSTLVTWGFKAIKKLAGYDKLVSKVSSKLEFKTH